MNSKPVYGLDGSGTTRGRGASSRLLASRCANGPRNEIRIGIDLGDPAIRRGVEQHQKARLLRGHAELHLLADPDRVALHEAHLQSGGVLASHGIVGHRLRLDGGRRRFLIDAGHPRSQGSNAETRV